MSGINFVINYLKSNPEASLLIIGYSDEIGNDEKNKKLALARANSVKQILVESGIEEARLKTSAAGEDASVDPNSKEARSYVRRVAFRIK